YIIVDVNKDNLLQFELIVGLLLYLWFPTLMLYLILQQYKWIYINETKITIKWIFGLITKSYNFDEVKRGDYIFGAHGIILKPNNSEQFTIGSKEFENYNEISKAISSNIQLDN